MKPYYQEGGQTIYHGDTLQVLAALRAEGQRFNAVAMDPPYASGTRQEAKKSTSGAMVRGQRFSQKPIENDQMTTQGFVWLMRETALAFLPMLTDGDSVFSFIDWRQWPNLLGALESCNLRVNAMVVWDKMSYGLGNGFRAQHELVMHASKGTPRILDHGSGNVLRHAQTIPIALALDLLARLAPDSDLSALPAKVQKAMRDLLDALAEASPGGGDVLRHRRDDDPDHPSPKPPSLLEDLLHVVVEPGNSVLDCFMGAGSTLEACKRMGLRGTGIECVEAHCETAAKKLRQQTMFVPRVADVVKVEQMSLLDGAGQVSK